MVSTATVLSLNWIHLKIISGATFRIIGLTKIPKIEFLSLDWIYRSIQINTVCLHANVQVRVTIFSTGSKFRLVSNFT